MQARLFGPVIYSRGKSYYRKNKVKNVLLQNDTYYADVLGTYKYSVAITLDKEHKKVKYMSCNCPYALDNHKCKHEAALYIYLHEEGLIQEQSNKENLNELYKRLLNENSYAYMADNKMRQEIYKRTNQYDTHSDQVILNTIKLLEEVDDIQCSQYAHNSFIEIVSDKLYALNRFFELQDELLDYYKKGVIEGKHYIYLNLLCTSLEKYSDDEKINHYLDILSNKLNVINSAFCLNELFVLYKRNDRNDVIEKLNYYKNRNEYHNFILYDLLKNNKDDQLVQYIDEHNIDLSYDHLLEDVYARYLYCSKSYEEYEGFIIRCIKENRDKFDIDYIVKLKEKDIHKWNEKKYNMFLNIDGYFPDSKFKKIINEVEEYQVAGYFILNKSSYNLFNQFSSIIKKNDLLLYRYLYVHVLSYAMENDRLYLSEEEFMKCLKDISKTKISKEEMVSVLLLLQSKLSHTSYYFELIENYLKEGGFENYVEIIEY